MSHFRSFSKAKGKGGKTCPKEDLKHTSMLLKCISLRPLIYRYRSTAIVIRLLRRNPKL